MDAAKVLRRFSVQRRSEYLWTYPEWCDDNNSFELWTQDLFELTSWLHIVQHYHIVILHTSNGLGLFLLVSSVKSWQTNKFGKYYHLGYLITLIVDEIFLVGLVSVILIRKCDIWSRSYLLKYILMWDLISKNISTSEGLTNWSVFIRWECHRQSTYSAAPAVTELCTIAKNIMKLTKIKKSRTVTWNICSFGDKTSLTTFFIHGVDQRRRFRYCWH